MDSLTFRRLLDEPAQLNRRLRDWGLTAPEIGAEHWRELAEQVPLELLASLAGQLGEHLPQAHDPDRAFAGLMRFLASALSPLAMLSLFERDGACLPMLCQIFGTSDAWTELLLRDPEAFDYLRLTEGMPTPREELQAEVDRETALLTDERILMAALKRRCEREQLRIGYGELFRHVRIEMAMQQLTELAEVIVSAALRFAWQRGTDGANKKLPRLAVIGLGRFGGRELDYRLPLKLLFVVQNVTSQEMRRGNPLEVVERVARQTIRVLQAPEEGHSIYPVLFPIHPTADAETLVHPLDDLLYYCDAKGRTWERSILLTARPIAGDLELGREFLAQLQPWLFRRYLYRADETGMRAFKRRILREAAAAPHDLELGPGGIRQIEQSIRFLQLLSGGELEIVRRGGTRAGIAGLEQAGVMTVEERSVLEQGYEHLRRWEHRSQLLGTALEPGNELRERQQQQAQTLERVLASAFDGEVHTHPVAELVLDPLPTAESISTALRPFGFQDVHTAAAELRSLAVERIPFLSTRRSRHFLAEIAPTLLQSIAATPDPDYTLARLARVSESLGGKGVLWELFRQHPPSQELYVRLCGASLYLTELLTSNPGMIDDLLDSLLLNHLPTVEELEALAGDLLQGVQAQSMQSALAAFRQSQHLRIGVREMLGLEDVAATHRALAAVAEVCVRRVAAEEYAKLAERHGEPGTANGDHCEIVILALGKVGGNEPNYHSPLELAFIYESDGMTQLPLRSRSATSTTNAHFFSLLAQRVLKTLTELGPQGKLYEVHTPIRPQGKTGPVAIAREHLRQYLLDGPISMSERQLLVKSRAIFGVATARAAVQNLIVESLLARPWKPAYAEEVRQARRQMEESASGRNLKRAPGGTTDVEAVIHVLQWQHAEAPDMIGVGTLTAIDRLRERGWLSPEDADHWSGAYRFLRRVESALRLMNFPSRHELPSSSVDWRKLAMILQHPESQDLAEQVRGTMNENRERFEKFFAAG